MIVESKNLILEHIYGQAPLSVNEVLDWCRGQAEFLKPYITDTGALLEQAASRDKNILFEAQLGALRDIDYGIYPYTSSSSTIAAYATIGAGIPKRQPDRVVGVMKAYSTCVGEGPFVAEKAAGEEWNEKLRKAGNEFGAATGRPRRVGPFDAVASRYGLQCQNAGDIALTKLDVLSCFEKIPVIMGYRVNGKLITDFPTNILLDDAMPEIEMLDGWNCDISSCKNWNDLPENAKKYIERIEELIGHSIYLVSTGAKRDAYLLKE